MSLIRFPEINDFVSPTRFGSMLERFFNDNLDTRFGAFTPSVDIVEDDAKFEVHVAVPGMEKENFKIEAQKGLLTISGERKWENEEKGKTYHKVETQYGKFTRSFHLPDNVDASKIEATYQNGMLVAHLPKTEPKNDATNITVK